MAGFGIRVESLGKRYRITPAVEPGRRMSPLHRFRRESLWALRGIDFELPRGSTLGVVGRNGAGKTTLLKILSQVTVPTEGRVLIAGKASSLLEVGTGFHQDLTGRENIYMNGAVLGMSRREIDRKFDEIVAFSEVERFVDTPVKRYSTGMNLRLAFAVAAHLEPDVLLVDEVLAVGDAAFQAKSLGKMSEVTKEGRTVVLVSHNMPTIASFAERCMWIDEGRIAEDGPPSEVIQRYLERSGPPEEQGQVALADRRRAPGHSLEVRYASIRLLDEDGMPRTRIYEGRPLTIEVELEAARPARTLETRAYVKTVDGFWLFSSLSGKRSVEIAPGRVRTSTRIDPNPLRPGRYRIDLGLQTTVPQDFVEDAVRFEVVHSLEGYDDPVLRGNTGHLRLDLDWTEPEPVDHPERHGTSA